MKIIIDFRMKNNSGIGIYLKNIYSQLDSYRQKKQLSLYLIEKDIPIYTLREQFNLFLLIKKADYFWSPHYNIPILPIMAKKRIVTIHDVYHLAFNKELSIFQRIYSQFMINFAVRVSDIIFTVSKFSKNEIIKYTNCDPKKIIVVYNGIDQNYNSNYPLKIINEKYILYVGNIKPHKNLKNAIKAFKLFSIKHPSYRFYIVGKKEGFINEGYKELQPLVDELGDKIFFTGWVSEFDLKNFYANASLFIFPSYYEGFGFPPLEAMACGCPTIVSNAASIPEICGDASLYFDPHNVDNIALTIETILMDKTKQEYFRTKGLERIKKYKWDESIKQKMFYLEKTLNENSNSTRWFNV